jgi:hypothetical protein
VLLFCILHHATIRTGRTHHTQGVLTPGMSSSYQPTPELIPGLTRVTHVAAAEHHTLALCALATPPLPLQRYFSMSVNMVLAEHQTSSAAVGGNINHCSSGTAASATVSAFSRNVGSTGFEIDWEDLDINDDDDDDSNENVVKEEKNSFVFPYNRQNLRSSSCVDATDTSVHGSAGEQYYYSRKQQFIGSMEHDDSLSLTAVPSLRSLAERKIAQRVHVHNAVSFLNFAENYTAPLLSLYCTDFIKL